jgi:hypothetical protein
MSIRGRIGAVVGVGVFAAASVVVSAGGASAMGTFPCNQKGTAGNNIINVSVPAGHTDAAHPWVVCPGNGNDTVNIVNVTAHGPAYLYIAMGNGNKTVNWNAGNVSWGCDPIFCGVDLPGRGIITRPDINGDIVMGGSNPNSDGSLFACGTNLQYRAASSPGNFANTTQSYLWWFAGVTEQFQC